ncbi:MAG: DNA polymerase I [Gammaproteobacteria bacterium]|nr:DNA polymerase I [Gammaproteobacteria bacterium]MDP2139712.1 DNA polymerase I [Gammaproteobacteria bacterium]MDP2348915.1 DNA polymerase I [Gammaproteobacteria bacterium]
MDTNLPREVQLILVDGSSYLFRAFHALPPLNTSKGQPTGAIKGVINMIRSLVKTYPDSHIAVVFDAKGNTFRNDIYAEYKAHRPPMPDELRSQIEPIHAIIKAMGLPMLVIEGVEADDVIGTLATQAEAMQICTLISTGDKDLAQLVTNNVTLLNTMTNEVLDPAGVTAKFGLPPERIVEYLALTGDKADNIPGVPSVGPKTAVKWLQEYGSLEGLLANMDKVSGKIGERLRENIDQLWLSHRLATIKRDVPLDVTIENLVHGEEDKDELHALFSLLEFKSWIKEVEGKGGTSSKKPTQKELPDVVRENSDARPIALEQAGEATQTTAILDEQTLDACIVALRNASQIAISLETDGAHYMEAAIVGIALCIEPGKAFYIPVGHDSLEFPSQLDRNLVIGKLRPLLENARTHKVAHDCKFLIHVFENHGVAFSGYRFDTLTGSYVLNSVVTDHTLEKVAEHYLHLSMPSLEQLLGKGKGKLVFSQLDLTAATDFAGRKSDLVLRLNNFLTAELARTGELAGLHKYYELALIPVLQRMERYGIHVDADVLGKQSQAIAIRLVEVEREAYRLAGEEFNLSSPKQLQTIFYDKLKLPVLKKTPTGQPSTAEPVLQELALEYELPKLIMDHRGLSKLKSTYTDKLPLDINKRTGRIHSSFQQAVAATGRLSSIDPNLQNIPIRTAEGRKVRQAFIARPGYKLLAADYSQVELRIMAHLSGDPGLLKAFSSAQDVHRATASEVFATPLEEVTSEQRRRAKAINFGLIYGMSAFGLAKQLGIDRHSAQHYVDLYFQKYPGVLQYMDQTQALADELGYVETIFGRRLYLPDIHAGNGMLRKAAQRTAINAPMQGSAADIIKQAMIDIDHWLATGVLDAHMVLQVHDELVFEVAEADVDLLAEGVRFRMVTAAALHVPLVVDVGVGNNWDEAH